MGYFDTKGRVMSEGRDEKGRGHVTLAVVKDCLQPVLSVPLAINPELPLKRQVREYPQGANESVFTPSAPKPWKMAVCLGHKEC